MSLYLIHYKTTNARRRRRVRRILRAYGWEPEPGLFECPLAPVRARELQRRLDLVLGPDDRIRFYQVCSDCLSQSWQGGGDDIAHIPDVWLF